MKLFLDENACRQQLRPFTIPGMLLISASAFLPFVKNGNCLPAAHLKLMNKNDHPVS
jgi:hypothetical protein